jgi:hypothetical protein
VRGPRGRRDAGAKALVGSEELEPGPGWPHAAILGDLAKSPTMTASTLAATIVRRYVESYRYGVSAPMVEV